MGGAVLTRHGCRDTASDAAWMPHVPVGTDCSYHQIHRSTITVRGGEQLRLLWASGYYEVVAWRCEGREGIVQI